MNLKKKLDEAIDYMPHDKTLQKVVNDLQILNSEARQLQGQWDRQRAASIARMLKSSAALLEMLVEKST